MMRSMPVDVSSPPYRAIAVLSALLLTCGAAAQVPDGWIVASSFRTTNAPSSQFPFPGIGGLYLFHPTIPGPPIAVGGLGPDLTGAGLPAPFSAHGANCVLRRPSDGALIVGETTRPGDQVDVHLLTLGGTVQTGINVVAASSYYCGMAGSQTASITQMAFLPTGQVIMALGFIASGPLAGAVLAILDLPTGVVTPVPLSTPFIGFNALAFDPVTDRVYLGAPNNSPGNPPSTSGLYCIPTPVSGGPALTATFVQNVPFQINNLAVDNAGYLVAGGATGDVLRVHPGTGAITPLGVPPAIYNAISVERVTGNYVLFSGSGGLGMPATANLQNVGSSGTGLATLSTLPQGGWGVISGLDIDHDPESYGAATPGTNNYTWALAPNPGGLPIAGNQGFSLTLRGLPACAPGILGASLARLTPAVVAAGISLNIDLSPMQLLALVPIACTIANEVVLPLPLPLGSTGIQLFLQTAHYDPQGVAASPGLELTVL